MQYLENIYKYNKLLVCLLLVLWNCNSAVVCPSVHSNLMMSNQRFYEAYLHSTAAVIYSFTALLSQHNFFDSDGSFSRRMREKPHLKSCRCSRRVKRQMTWLLNRTHFKYSDCSYHDTDVASYVTVTVYTH